MTLTVRRATEDDGRLLWEWVNDPAVRQASFRSEPIPWQEHLAWFRAKRADPRRVIFIVLDYAQRPIGQVRFEPPDEAGNVEVIISIASEHRGQGHGVGAIRAACDVYRRLRLAKRITAYIKPENVASQKAFEKAGFVRQGTGTLRNHEAVCLMKEVAG